MDLSVIFAQLGTSENLRNLGLSLFLLAALLGLRHLLLRFVLSREGVLPSVRQQWLVNSRNIFISLYILLLMMVWASELRSTAIALAAFVVAFVIGTKEVLSSLQGAALIALAKYYKVGDRIRIQTYRGDVTDMTMLNTTLAEVDEGGHYTGQQLTFPNSMVLTNFLHNEPISSYTFSLITFYLKPHQDIVAARALLLAIAGEVSASYLEEAQAGMARQSNWVLLPTLDPIVSVRMLDHENVQLTLRLPVRHGNKYEVEQEITTRFFRAFWEHP